jgi:hypothetical protein
MTNAEIRRQLSAGQTTGEYLQGESFKIERSGIYAPEPAKSSAPSIWDAVVICLEDLAKRGVIK